VWAPNPLVAIIAAQKAQSIYCRVLRRERILVQSIPAWGKARSASTDVGGLTVNKSIRAAECGQPHRCTRKLKSRFCMSVSIHAITQRQSQRRASSICCCRTNCRWKATVVDLHSLVGLHYYPRESFREGLCNHRRWFVCLFVCYHDTK